jgi:hypothetical protein
MNANSEHPADKDQNGDREIRKTSRLSGLIGLIVLVMLVAIWILTTSGYTSQKSLRIEQTNRLKQLGLALRIFDTDNPGQRLTNLNQLVASGYARPEALIDPLNGEPFVLAKQSSEAGPQDVMIYGARAKSGGGNAVMGDGSVQSLESRRFKEAIRSKPINTGNPPPTNRNPPP